MFLPDAKLTGEESHRFQRAVYRFWTMCNIAKESGYAATMARENSAVYFASCSPQELSDIEAIYLFLRGMIIWTLTASNAEELPMWSQGFGEISIPLALVLRIQRGICAQGLHIRQYSWAQFSYCKLFRACRGERSSALLTSTMLHIYTLYSPIL